MQAYLLNFGDNTRVVNDTSNSAVSIGIGELKECDIHDVHFHMIRRGVANETLLVVPKDVRRTERLDAIMALMRELMTEAYDDVLAKYNMLGDADDDAPRIRPTRDQMRHHLRDLARQEVATALKLQSKVNIREQGDAVTRQPVQAPAPVPDTIKTEIPGLIAPTKGDDKPAQRSKPAKKAKRAAKSQPVPKTKRVRERL